ncbi:MAG: hypothetical protein GWP59_08680 [Chlamydiales bacterium]|nr:hypothetical protein [Chlamydiales bacterium]NCF71760.1 hypothetical protein [Chlamydiales bacterium]
MPKRVNFSSTSSFSVPGRRGSKKRVGGIGGRRVASARATAKAGMPLTKRADSYARGLIKNIECVVEGGSSEKKVRFKNFTGNKRNTGAKGDDIFGPIESIYFIKPAKMLSDDNLLKLTQRVSSASQKARLTVPAKRILKASSEAPLLDQKAMDMIVKNDAAYGRELADKEVLNSICAPYKAIFLEAGGDEKIIKEKLGEITSAKLDEDDRKLLEFELKEKDETLKREASEIRMKVFMLRPDLDQEAE